jgi:Double zinc ribbon
MPWWSELKLPGSEAVSDLLWDLESETKFFPATKMKILKMAGEEDEELLTSLPERMYDSTSDIAAVLVEHLPPIESQKQTTEIFWKSPVEALAPGQQLLVPKDQVVLLVSKSGKGCEEFPEGRYTLSRATCPLLAQESRKVLPGYSYSILNGAPYYFAPAFEFEIDLTIMGQTRSLRRAAAKGTARVRIVSPKKFVEQLTLGKNPKSEQGLSAVTKYSSDLLKKEISQNELQELSSNPSLLEVPLKEGLTKAGLDPIRISFSYVGEFGPGMFMPSPGQPGAPQSPEQARQMAESMRAAQMARLQAMQEMMQQRQGLGAMPPSMVNCPNCNTANPQGSKFCNNCGKALQVAKKTCSSCGKLSDLNVKFCGNCGTKL